MIVLLERVPLTLERLRERKAEILAVAAKHGASNLRVFGSVARGKADGNSDLDLLVDLEEGRSLWDLGGLTADLEDLLGVRVDVGTARSLRPEIRDEVIAEAIAL
ncbi:nucleotidyltransferase family protein [Calidithermus terrae]|uniref:nucleotidyltransferase family protein n=1 Tax=Calidithermus terrae TaxID=1408545 RepID=UPI001FE370DA|nr:nucleotidyltransferase family protein [Calidithermus terrae]